MKWYEAEFPELKDHVAPFTGAWVEIEMKVRLEDYLTVAPFTGAWVEISSSWVSFHSVTASHPSRVRGLKCSRRVLRTPPRMSHPSRVRGLKWTGGGFGNFGSAVAPFTGAWVEIW